MVRCVSLVNADRHVTIASGEMYLECGILKRESRERAMVDKRSLGNPGNGMLVKKSDCRRGADPPRNISGSARAVSSVQS